MTPRCTKCYGTGRCFSEAVDKWGNYSFWYSPCYDCPLDTGPAKTKVPARHDEIKLAGGVK